MAEITEAAYEDLRDYIENNWTHVGLEDSTGEEFTRIDISDARAEWLHSDGDQVLEYELTVTGGDSDIDLPQEISKAKLYNTSSGGSELTSSSIDDITFKTTADKLVITIEIEVPELT